MGGQMWSTGRWIRFDRLVQAEVHHDGHADGDGLAILFRGLEAVAENGFESLFIEAHAQGTNDAGILRISLSVDDDRNCADSLIFFAARFIGEFRFGSEDGNGLGDSAGTWGKNTAACTAIRAGTEADAVTGAVASV